MSEREPKQVEHILHQSVRCAHEGCRVVHPTLHSGTRRRSWKCHHHDGKSWPDVQVRAGQSLFGVKVVADILTVAGSVLHCHVVARRIDVAPKGIMRECLLEGVTPEQIDGDTAKVINCFAKGRFDVDE